MERSAKGKGMEGIIETANPNAAPRRQNIKAKELGKNDGSDAEDDSDIPGTRVQIMQVKAIRKVLHYMSLYCTGKSIAIIFYVATITS